MKLLLVYPPFCTPTTIPYSISYLKSFLNDNIERKRKIIEFDTKCIDLNAKWHRLKFNNLYKDIKIANSIEEYGDVLNNFRNQATQIYYDNHQLILNNEEPEYFNDIINKIIEENPTHVALSFVYNSQVFWGTAIINKLNKLGIKCYIGGPAVTDKLKQIAKFANHEVEFLEQINKELNIIKKDEIDMNNLNCNTIVNFNDYDNEDYLSKEPVVPIRTTVACPYKKCTFCTHHANGTYIEYDIDSIVETIKQSKFKHICFIDDYILPMRLKILSEKLKGIGAKWWIQTKPVKEIIPLLKEASLSGLTAISWGLESGSQEILDKIKKGTNIRDIEAVLNESKSHGIINIVYVIFGFPTETKEQFVETIDFLKQNSNNLDMVSTSIFGLQEGSYIYKNPEEFKIKKINREERTLLPPKITYDIQEGMTTKQATRLKDKYSKTLKSLNKLPASFNIYKEQIILF